MMAMVVVMMMMVLVLVMVLTKFAGQHQSDPCCSDPCRLESQYNPGETTLNMPTGFEVVELFCFEFYLTFSH